MQYEEKKIIHSTLPKNHLITLFTVFQPTYNFRWLHTVKNTFVTDDGLGLALGGNLQIIRKQNMCRQTLEDSTFNLNISHHVEYVPGSSKQLHEL